MTPQLKTQLERTPQDIKEFYSDEVLALLEDVWIKEKLKEAHRLRSLKGLKVLSDVQLIEYVLKLHNNKRINYLRKKGLLP